MTSVNDAPRAAPLTLPATEDGASVSIDLMQGASDVDDANPLILDAASVSALHASMTLTGTQLAIDPTHGDFQDIAAGATRDLTVTYDIKDNQGATLTQTLTVRITGTNDGPVLSAAQTALPDGTEDNAYSLSLGILQKISPILMAIACPSPIWRPPVARSVKILMAVLPSSQPSMSLVR